MKTFKTHLKYCILSALTIMNSSIGYTQTNYSQALEQGIDIQQKITSKNIVQIPFEKIIAIEDNNEIYFLSENGRFAIKGEMYDVLSRRFLKTLHELKEVTQRINFKNLKGIDFNLLNTFSIGNDNPYRVVTFIDPFCELCKKQIEDIEKLISTNKEFATKFEFVFIPIPANGKKSLIVSQHIGCLKREKDRKRAFEKTKKQTWHMSEQFHQCNDSKNISTTIVANMLRIDRVPFTIAPNGEIAKGLLQNLETWLSANKE